MIIKFKIFESIFNFKKREIEYNDNLIDYGNEFLISDIEKDEPNKKKISVILNRILKDKYVNFYTILGEKRGRYITKIEYSRLQDEFYFHTLPRGHMILQPGSHQDTFVLNDYFPIKIVDGPKIIISEIDPLGEEDWDN